MKICITIVEKEKKRNTLFLEKIIEGVLSSYWENGLTLTFLSSWASLPDISHT